jgi:hypothetical protein
MPKQNDWNQTKRELQAELDTAQTAEVTLTAERDELSFPALVMKDKTAIERLAAVNTELQGLTARTASIRAAIAETDRRIAENTKAELSAAQQQRAQTAWPIAEALVERGRKMDQALRAYLNERVALEADLAQLARLGAPAPSRDLVSINLRNGHDAAFSMLDRHSRPVAPNYRRSFEQLAEGWSLPARKWLAAKLHKPSPVSEAPVKGTAQLEAELETLRERWRVLDEKRKLELDAGFKGPAQNIPELERVLARIRGIERELGIEAQALGTPVTQTTNKTKAARAA